MTTLVFLLVLARLLCPSAATSAVSGVCRGSCGLHPAFLKRIQTDVAWLDELGGITDGMIRNISLVCDAKVSHQCNARVVRMMIKGGEVYLNSLHPNWRLGPPELIGFLIELYETSKKYRLPDVEFAYNGDDDATSPAFDWTFRSDLKTVFHGGPFPLLAWSKSGNSFAQLVPYSGAFRCTDDSFDTLLARLDDVRRVAWHEKKQVAFGRWNMFCASYNYMMPHLPSGEPFTCPRQWLPTLAALHKDIMDVAYLGDPGKGPTARPVPMQHQNAYKYLVSTDGWAISSKFDKYLLLGSVVIKARSSRFGYYYDALKPGEHYMECMNSSLDDTLKVVHWLRDHDDEAARVAAAAQQFAVAHLHREARLCYYRTLMEELGKRMKYRPSCSARGMCVPLGRFLDFLSRHSPTAGSCKYAETLLRYGTGSAATEYTDEKLQALLQDDKLWPRDNVVPPLNHEPYFPGHR